MRPNGLLGVIAPTIFGFALGMGAGPASADELRTSMTGGAKADGGASMSVANTPSWLEGAQFGVDVSFAAAAVEAASANHAPPSAVPDASTAAWAKVKLPTEDGRLPWDQTSVDLRMDPAQNAGRVGTTLTRNWEVGEHVTASVSDSYALTRDADQASGWETNKSASVSLKDTGTTVLVGATNSGGTAWLPSASAQQTLIGPLNVTTSVTDTGSEINKSIMAGFKTNW